MKWVDLDRLREVGDRLIVRSLEKGDAAVVVGAVLRLNLDRPAVIGMLLPTPSGSC
jgi:hypothetical protein